MRLLAYTFIAWACLGSSVTAVGISFVGSRPEKVGQLERRLNHLDRAGTDDSVLVDSAVTWLQSAGYLDAVARHEQDHLSITAGWRYILKELKLPSDSNSALPLSIPFTRVNFDLAVDSLLRPVQDSGYFYSRAAVIELTRNGNQITANLSVNRGPRVVVNSSIYSGLTRTRPETISRFIRLSKGDILTASALQNAENEAGRIPFVRFQPPIRVRPRPGYTETDIEFVMEERRLLQFLGGAGVTPDDPAGVVWSFDLKLLSPFGTGREIAVRSERREKGRRQLDVTYRQSVFIAGPGDLALSLATRDYRDDFYEFAAGAQFSTHLSGRMTTGLKLGWKRVTPAHDQPVYSAYSVEYSIERNSLDHPLNPANGLLLQMSLAYTYRRQASSESSAPGSIMSAGGEAFNETRSNLSAEIYRSLVGRLVGHLSLEYTGLESDDNLPPFSELALIGGAGTLRGYRNEQFAAQRALLGTVEPRLRFRPGYLFVFYDAAYLNRRLSADGNDTVTEELYRDAAGIGLALLGQHRSVKLSLGWNTDAALDQPRLSIELRSDL